MDQGSHFLGHIISEKGISMDLAKIQTILEWLTLKTVIDIQSFFELAGYYRRFIKDFFLIATPMTRLTRKDVKFVWDGKCKQNFQTQERSSIIALVMTLPDGNDDFVIFSDELNLGLGFVLMQHGKLLAYTAML